MLHVPNFFYNLLSISKITHDRNFHANFYLSHYEFQELASRKTTGSVRKSKGLYFLKDGMKSSEQLQSTCFESISISSDSEIMLWHNRLGHPSF